jgi:chromate transporter
MNLAIWFAIHSVFHGVRPVRGFGFDFDAPALASVDPWALALSAAAMLAIFRFKAGMLQTLGACSAAGVALYAAGALT